MPPKHVPDASQRIDGVIAKSEPFAREILIQLREIIHHADPEIIEDWKWGPNFYHNGMVCGIWGFKKHVSMVFFRGDRMKDRRKLFNDGKRNAHNRMIKFASVDEVNSNVILEYVKEAVSINEMGAPEPKKTITIPADFGKALSNAKLLISFKAMAFTHRKEYILWIIGAKKAETRLRRIRKAVGMIAAGMKGV